MNERGPDVIVIAEREPSQVAVIHEAANTQLGEVRVTAGSGEHEEGLEPLVKAVRRETRTGTDEALVGHCEEENKEGKEEKEEEEEEEEEGTALGGT